MRRLFWLALGATAAVLVMRKLSKAAEKLTPESIAGSIGAGLSDLASSLGEFVAEVRAASRAREDELRDAATNDAGGLNDWPKPATNR